jgi:hypothetical protein
MRSLGFALCILLIAGAAVAADPTPQQQNPTLVVVTPQEPQRVDVEIGAAEINTHAAHIRVAYLPRLAPLPGTRLDERAYLPNALALTSTPLPYRPGLRPSANIVVGAR